MMLTSSTFDRLVSRFERLKWTLTLNNNAGRFGFL